MDELTDLLQNYDFREAAYLAVGAGLGVAHAVFDKALGRKRNLDLGIGMIGGVSASNAYYHSSHLVRVAIDGSIAALAYIAGYSVTRKIIG